MLKAVVVCTVAVSAASARAGPSPGPPDRPAAAAPPATPALAGPEVREDAPGRTLVVRSFDGGVRRPEVPAEFAAADLLELDEAARAAVAAIAAERALVLDEFVSTNLDLLSRIDSASNAGRRFDLLLLGHEALVKLEPLRAKGRLEERVRSALPEGSRAEYDRILSEYWAAVVADGTRQKRPDGKPRSRLEAIADERLSSLGREIEQAFARILQSGELVYRLLLDGIALRPAQAERIRGLISDFAERYGEDAAEKDWAVLGISIAAHLDPEQLVRFGQNIKRLM